jgi:Leucine-rich repeat (LRR) protein
MEGFQDLVNLRKLYLEKNLIYRLEGLESCRMLEELNLNNQLVSSQMFFSFDEYSLAAISGSLRELHLQNCRINEPKPIYYLEHLSYLNLKDNLITDFDEQVCPLLQTMNYLQRLWLIGNPVTTISKYRDQVVLLSNSVSELDDKDIKE